MKSHNGLNHFIALSSLVSAFLLPLLVAQYSVVYSIPNGESPSFVFLNPDKQKWCTKKRSTTPTSTSAYVQPVRRQLLTRKHDEEDNPPPHPLCAR